MKTSFKVSLGGVTAALGLVLMFLTAVFPFGTFALPTLAGVLLIVIVIEIGFGYAFAVYAATAILSFLLVPDKEAALVYTAFFGFYPIIKGWIERIKSKAVQYVLKYSIFNICIIASFFIAINLLGIDRESYEIFGYYIPFVLLIFANAFFLLYDISVTRLVTLYLHNWRQKINKNTKL